MMEAQWHVAPMALCHTECTITRRCTSKQTESKSNPCCLRLRQRCVTLKGPFLEWGHSRVEKCWMSLNHCRFIKNRFFLHFRGFINRSPSWHFQLCNEESLPRRPKRQTLSGLCEFFLRAAVFSPKDRHREHSFLWSLVVAPKCNRNAFRMPRSSSKRNFDASYVTSFRRK